MLDTIDRNQMCKEIADRYSLTLHSIEYVKIGTQVSDLTELTRVICELATGVDTLT